jgi:formylglycine-generating enzyme required for sulfatase activity
MNARALSRFGRVLRIAGLAAIGWSAAARDAMTAGASVTIEALALELRRIEPGTFTMGSAPGTGNDDERPATRVTLTKPYWLGKTEVTQAQWRAVMGDNPSYFRGAERPVEQVRWSEAMEFCRLLTERERAAGRLPAGHIYTLPTEAQWEYACRAGTTGDYAGDLDAMAWYFDNAGLKTHPVAQKRPNAWGLHDMHGNVYEWTLDAPGAYPGGHVTDPAPAVGRGRIFRGGSNGSIAAICRSALRWPEPGFGRWFDVGFRIALSPAP